MSSEIFSDKGCDLKKRPTKSGNYDIDQEVSVHNGGSYIVRIDSSNPSSFEIFNMSGEYVGDDLRPSLVEWLIDKATDAHTAYQAICYLKFDKPAEE